MHVNENVHMIFLHDFFLYRCFQASWVCTVLYITITNIYLVIKIQSLLSLSYYYILDFMFINQCDLTHIKLKTLLVRVLHSLAQIIHHRLSWQFESLRWTDCCDDSYYRSKESSLIVSAIPYPPCIACNLSMQDVIWTNFAWRLQIIFSPAPWTFYAVSVNLLNERLLTNLVIP